MLKPNFDVHEYKALKRAERRDEKRRINMKVNGAQVKKLAKIIKEKNENNFLER